MARRRKLRMSEDARGIILRKLIKKGRDAEGIALKACQELKNEGKIKGFRDTGKARGKDLVIYTNEGDFFPVEIKSSWIGLFEHQMRYKTPCLVIYLERPSPSPRKIKNRIRQVKRDLLALLKRQSEMAGQ